METTFGQSCIGFFQRLLRKQNRFIFLDLHGDFDYFHIDTNEISSTNKTNFWRHSVMTEASWTAVMPQGRQYFGEVSTASMNTSMQQNESDDGVQLEAWRAEKGEMKKERWISCHPWSTTNQVSIFRFTVNGFRLRFKSFLSCIALNQYIGFRLIECTSIVLKWAWMSFVLS